MKILRWGLMLWVMFAAMDSITGSEIVRDPYAIFLIVAIMQWILTVCHELGHAVVAGREGCRVTTIAALPWAYDLGKRRVGWAKQVHGPDIAGYVEMDFPRSITTPSVMRIAAAGPMAELCLALALFASVAIMPGGQVSSRPVVTVVPDKADLSSPAAQPARLPDQKTIEAVLSSQRWTLRVKQIEELARAMAILAFGGFVINLIPIGGSDGAVLLAHIRGRRISKP